MAIYFHAEKITYQLKGKREIRKWIGRVIENEGKITGEINIIFSSDAFLLKINNQYLQRNYYTDIITFDYSDDQKVSGDLFISIDRIRENAKSHNVKIINELMRIIVHGVLHMLGYKDDSEEEKKSMTAKENNYLDLLEKEN